ncbi:hypothetical protein [Clostridium beijerinckii]|uniref:hypothetical protein n=1 Tax=Clostridium beijerinckii TaxID=1520 RepID=UPI0022E93E8B|nr:hypothetical protein [Clostridium beijerinckii]
MEDDKIEALLMKIIENQNKMQSNITEIKSDIVGMKSDISEIKGKVDSIYDQTADLTEFRTGTKEHFITINKDVKLIKQKLHKTEEDVFDIKGQLKIVK